MEQPVTFHALVLPNTEIGETLAQIRWLERIGIDRVGIADHVVDWTGNHRSWHEVMTVIAAAAATTSTVGLASHVAQIALHHPAALVRQALSINCLSRGRFQLGLGAGLPSDPSPRMVGVADWSNGERVARFEEFAEIVRTVTSDDGATFHGEFYRAEDATLSPPGADAYPLSIAIAALGPRMIRAAARFADTWNSLSFERDFEDQLDQTRGRIQLLHEACSDLGRDPASVTTSYTMFDASSRERSGALWYYESQDVFRAAVSRVLSLGISDIGVYVPASLQQRDVLEAIARTVMPELRASTRHAHGPSGH